MRQLHDTIVVRTSGRGMTEITDRVGRIVASSGITSGSCTLAILHTSASLLVQENADPAVQRDLATFLAKLCPEHPALYEHDDEGPDDMPSHLRAAVLPSSLTIPIEGGALRLGRWQGVFACEHRTGGRERRLAVHCWGE